MSRQDPLSADDGAAIRLLALDVDGVLTDSQLYFGNDGEELKSFSTLDGQGIKLLQDNGIVVALITARESALVARRAANLGIKHVYQGRHDKLTALQDLTRDLALDLSEVAYIGDDLPDLACIRRVGLGITVPNGHGSVKQYARMITAARGGQGAVREVCDFLLKSQGLYEKAIAPYL
jgi:3-deoxy-D-manno-octulosonate 8-phosphate phosphatase (KDO 8-P phosphatase)